MSCHKAILRSSWSQMQTDIFQRLKSFLRRPVCNAQSSYCEDGVLQGLGASSSVVAIEFHCRSCRRCWYCIAFSSSVVILLQSSLLLRPNKLLLQLIHKVLHKRRASRRTINLCASTGSLNRSMTEFMYFSMYLPHATMEGWTVQELKIACQ